MKTCELCGCEMYLFPDYSGGPNAEVVVDKVCLNPDCGWTPAKVEPTETDAF